MERMFISLLASAPLRTPYRNYFQFSAYQARLFKGTFFAALLLLQSHLVSALPVHAQDQKLEIGQTCSFLAEETGRALNPEDLIKPEVAARLIPNQRRTGNQGRERRVIWYRCALENTESFLLNRIILVGIKTFDSQGYLLNIQTSEIQKLSLKDTSSWDRSFGLELEAKGQYYLVLREQNNATDSLGIDLKLFSHSAFDKAERQHQVFSALYYGAVLVMVFFNLFLFFSLRTQVYLLYCAYLLGSIFMLAAGDGMGIVYFWPADYNTQFGYQGAIVFLMFVALFVRSLLELKISSPWIDRVVVVFTYFHALLFLFSWFIPLSWTVTLVLKVSALFPIVLLIAGFTSIKHRKNTAIIYLIAWSSYLVVLAFQALVLEGAAWPDWTLMEVGYLIKVIAFFEMILFSFALSDRYRTIKNEAIRSKEELLALTQQQATVLEVQVAERTKELAQANKTKDKFFSIISHDLRGPLGSLAVIFNEMADKGSDLDDSLFQAIRNTTKNTHQLLENLLSWALSQKGELAFLPTNFLLTQALQPNLELFAGAARQKGIQLVAEWDKELYTLADQEMVTTVVRNLINNAIKFTPTGGEIRLRVQTQGDWLRIEIKDTGVGMSLEAQANLFRLDKKVDSRLGTNRETGSGLGLILCAEFVKRNGGEIGIISNSGEGSCFWFTLPKGGIGEALSIKAEAAILTKLAQMRVLLADDNDLHLETSGRVLKELGVSYHTATDGAQALKQFQAGQFDLVLLDIDMPELNGVKVNLAIRQLADPPPLLIALTSYYKQDLDHLDVYAEFDGYLNKPLVKEQLLKTLRPFLIET
ncbi:MAG: hypothetical protein A2527_01220 [Candidatus Lambdaproteobacteria bacterium RIFOXYD2_FULL_50_16]|uniref:histidine kinase n=1 Tax=Candidatus Lambdaproteobacteria bacterium RIFOXYD2_FULL_50_16 TaxID=1817772 RepID=A0A1F6GEN6_9PROT|nr:MAG: hypothetical protein A2527_01220 [Candidatus Lambdaproteobacteria bacterium RIFOXYD2_FULL_50_16]